LRYNKGVSTTIGYARVSTVDQTLEQQIAALTAAGAGKIFQDKISGTTRGDDRPGFNECLKYLREGDTLIVWRLDRLGRSMRHTVNTMAELTERGVTVRSLTDGVDTSTAAGRMIAGVMSSLAEYERESIRERIMLKLAHSRSLGKVGGRRPQLDAEQVETAKLMRNGGKTIAQICKTLGVSRTTLWRYLNEENHPLAEVGNPVRYAKASK
jgi:DNA invertase Pin-like site-specific DNA recombinase